MRILLAEDHTLMRAGLRALLETHSEPMTIFEAGDGRTALDLAMAERPDIALLDIAMPELNGLELAARLANDLPGTRVIMLSMHSTPSHVAHALRAGAAGYLLKDAAAEELFVALRAVSRGETYLSPAISKQVVDGFLGRSVAPAPDVLTPRQREILQLVAEGKATKDVAAILDLSVKTVEAHRSQIMARLGIHDLAGLVRYAIRTGLVSSER
ncbi:MAG TPA: response regulator transcription factor [Kofleriaceae bacterium]|nr:response regulator transcription factor [Kofleriaceae bacterium]